MERVGYNLPEPILNTKDPGRIAVCKVLQQRLDQQYFGAPGGLDNWYGQAETWINANTLARQQSADPEKYVETPWTMKVPVRQIADYDDNGIPTYTPWVDERLHAPKLPQYVKPQPQGGGDFADVARKAAAEDAAIKAAKEAAVLDTLLDIQRTVNAIRARLNF